VRGQNHYPQDIEWTVQALHPALRPNCAAAFSIDVDGQERLVLVAEVYPDRLADPAEVFAAVRDGVAEHGLTAGSIALLPPRALPKTSSGKIRRGHARTLFATGRLETLA